MRRLGATADAENIRVLRHRVYMYYRDHAPPHFHAFYAGQQAVFEIATGAMTQGHIPRRARNMVEEWIASRRLELQRNWDSAIASQPLVEIPPLD